MTKPIQVRSGFKRRLELQFVVCDRVWTLEWQGIKELQCEYECSYLTDGAHQQVRVLLSGLNHEAPNATTYVVGSGLLFS